MIDVGAHRIDPLELKEIITILPFVEESVVIGINPPYSPPLLLRRRQALHLRLFTRSRILTVATATIAVRSVVKIHIYRTWQRLATNGW